MDIKKNNYYTTCVVDLGAEGEGICKIENFTIFVENCIPEDEIKLKIIKLKKNYGYGKLIQIIKPSPFRVEPICNKFGSCGGCNTMSIEYSKQLSIKTNKVKNNLIKIGKISDVTVFPTIGMSNPTKYRNKAQFPVGYNNGKSIIGFYEKRSHNIVSIDNCPIQSDVSNEINKKIKNFIDKYNIPTYNEVNHTGLIRHVVTRVGFVSKEVIVTIVINSRSFKYSNELISELKDIPKLKGIVINYNTSETNVILGNKGDTIFGENYIFDYIDDLKFKISYASFFQVNPIQTKILYKKVLEFLELNGSETIIDAYCGIGTISLFLAKKSKFVYGIEIIEDAIKDAKYNAKINNINNTKFITGSSEDVLTDLYKDGIKADIIVVDPPRKGCEEKLLSTICDINPKKIAYVSCDSATLARDLKYLHEKGFIVDKVQPVDMFCHTTHVETIIMMTKA